MPRSSYGKPERPPSEDKDILTVAEVAALLQFGDTTVNRLIKAGKLRATAVVGRSNGTGRSRQTYRIERSAVVEFMKANEAPAAPAQSKSKRRAKAPREFIK